MCSLTIVVLTSVLLSQSGTGEDVAPVTVTLELVNGFRLGRNVDLMNGHGLDLRARVRTADGSQSERPVSWKVSAPSLSAILELL